MSTMIAGIIPEWSQGDRLRKARELTGLDRGDFAAALGVSRNTVTNYEHGKVEPRRPVMLAWAMRSGVSLEWLDGTPPPDTERPRVDSNHRPSAYLAGTADRPLQLVPVAA